jgi:hypothetical protein
MIALQGFMIVDRSAMYGSRNMFDQHRDMRLDIDNMGYEVINIVPAAAFFFLLLTGLKSFLKFIIAQELLALGERIGSVSTGLSEDLVSKCVIETIYCSSDQTQEEATCVICLVRIFTLFETEKQELGFHLQFGGFPNAVVINLGFVGLLD